MASLRFYQDTWFVVLLAGLLLVLAAKYPEHCPFRIAFSFHQTVSH